MARSFATMTEAQQTALMAKAKEIVDVSLKLLVDATEVCDAHEFFTAHLKAKDMPYFRFHISPHVNMPL